jgi:hypothetical protein
VVAANSIKKVGKRVVSRGGNSESTPLGVAKPETNPGAGASAQGPPQVADDILWGTQAIADEIGRTLSETQYLIRISALPIGRAGPKLIFASRRQLRAHLTPKISAT